MKTLIMMVGLPRSGKTTLARQQYIAYPRVNPDAIRLAIHGQPFIAEAEPFVWAIAHAMVDALFLAGHDHVVLDACNNTRKRRDEWKRGAWDRRVFETVVATEDECIARCHSPQLEEVIHRMAEAHEPVTVGEIGEKENLHASCISFTTGLAVGVSNCSGDGHTACLKCTWYNRGEKGTGDDL